MTNRELISDRRQPARRAVRLAAWLLAVMVAGGVARADQLLVKAGRAITLDGPDVAPAAVLIEDGKIIRVAESLEAGEQTRVVDFGPAVLMPGLVRAYSQTALAGGASEYTREITPQLSVRAAVDWRSRSFREALAEGVTSVCIAPGTENVIAGRALLAKTAGDDLPRRVVREDCGLVITLASDPRNRNRSRVRPDSIYVRQPTNRMGVVWMLRSSLDLARRDPAAHPLLAEALRGERTVFCVSRTHFDIESAVRLADEFEFAPAIVGGQEAYQVAPLLVARKLPVVLGPLSTATIGGVENTDPFWNTAGSLHKAGVTVALSGPQLIEQARFAVRFGMPREAALRAITVVPAQLLGAADRVGSLAPGRDADLVVFNGDPLEFTSRITAVLVDGVVVEQEE